VKALSQARFCRDNPNTSKSKSLITIPSTIVDQNKSGSIRGIDVAYDLSYVSRSTLYLLERRIDPMKWKPRNHRSYCLPELTQRGIHKGSSVILTSPRKTDPFLA
jgi:hypothetical protein